VKTSKTDAAMETTGLVLQLYQQQFGNLPVKISGDVDPLDVMAALTENRQVLTVGIVNPTKQEHALRISLDSGELSGTGQLWWIAHSDPWAYNEPGQVPQVVIQEKQLHDVAGEVKVIPSSVGLYRLQLSEKSGF
jgi:alpha-N-arabinofuranosidase